MRFFRLTAIIVLLLACVVLGSACAGAKGAEGPQGPKGDGGADGVGVESIVNNGNGTFTVNLTNGTAYTTDNFTGPQGQQGEQGPQGVQGLQGTPGIGVEWVGEWDSSVLYAKYDAVGYQGSSYISRQNDNTNHLPTDTNWWDLWLEKGETGSQGIQGVQGEKGDEGDTGDQGPQGIQGEPGPNMIVAMGTIIEGGSQVTITQDYNVGALYWNTDVDCWEVELSGIDFYYPDFVTLVTILGSGADTVQVGSVDGHLLVMMFDSSGNPAQISFSFVVLQVP